MMLTVLVGGRTALATQIAGALHVGIMSSQVELVAYVLVPALLGMAAVHRATTAREFAVGAVAVATGAAGVIIAFVLVGRAEDPLGVAQLLGGALVSGLGSGLLAFAGMAILGHVFRIPTVFELRELSDPNHPLLRQLLLRTPGTYHHSLLVGNLAERAAEVIGADPLVARVGAYYHDIGKMRNPTAFIENQTGGNPHDELDPLVSAGDVAADLQNRPGPARPYLLPAQIRQMIPGGLTRKAASPASSPRRVAKRAVRIAVAGEGPCDLDPVRRVIGAPRRPLRLPGEMGVALGFGDDAQMRGLNRGPRRIDRTTDVL